ncbi:hypothetical protein CMI37_26955 [Candidatus Pacearchaeota archaeon]|nr:hypothetical protein [Candidatus Pacearchaeota archaeon]|tara:strand:- start:29729 stop:30268 length:540 start_codon:yes stop_codon:yes gene_type:complete
MVDELRATYLHKNPLLRWFFRTKINLAVKLANLKKDDVILDFGCGAGWLKNKLKKQGFEVCGYDKTAGQGDLDDYTKIKPGKIFAMDVFEHIPKDEIKKIILNFKKMNPDFELITAIPTENLVSRKIRKLMGKNERVSDHITTLKEILAILNSELRLVRKINFLSVSWIGKFKNIETRR